MNLNQILCRKMFHGLVAIRESGVIHRLVYRPVLEKILRATTWGDG